MSHRAVVPMTPTRASPDTSSSSDAMSAAMSSISCSTRRARSTTTLAFVGQPAVRPVDQGDAELALELGDVPGDVGLHRVEGPRGGRERAVIGDGDDGGELADVHGRI